MVWAILNNIIILILGGNLILIRYLIVGGSTALLELLLFLCLHRILGLAIAGANISAMVVATGVNFLFNRNWSFRSKGKISQSFILYISLILFNMVFTTWLITVLVGWGMADYIAKVLVMGAATLWNFLLYKKVIFV